MYVCTRTVCEAFFGLLFCAPFACAENTPEVFRLMEHSEEHSRERPCRVAKSKAGLATALT